MALTERGHWCSSTVTDRGRAVFGNLTETGFAVFGLEAPPAVTGNPWWYYAMLKRNNLLRLGV